MTPSKAAKAAGHKSLSDAARIVGAKRQTLHGWYTTRRKLFDAVMIGARVMRDKDDREG